MFFLFLGFLECPKAYVFKGSKAVAPQEVQQQLGLVSRDPRGGAGGVAARRFLLPVAECEYAFNAILAELQRDQWPVPTDHRPERCTGVALSVALALLESCAAQQSGRVLLFTGTAVCWVTPLALLVHLQVESAARVLARLLALH